MKKIFTCFVVTILFFIINNCASAGIKASDIARIKVLPEVLKVKVGKSIELIAVGLTKDEKEIDIYPAWEVNEKDIKIGIINKTTGNKIKFTGKSPGVARVIVTTGNIARQLKITVTK
jgi:hypothetical protein